MPDATATEARHPRGGLYFEDFEIGRSFTAEICPGGQYVGRIARSGSLREGAECEHE